MAKQKMSRKRKRDEYFEKRNRYVMNSDSTEYQKGYADGMKASFESSELDAYYAGVGYAKKACGDKHIGFNSDLERQQFEDGMKNKSKHFRSYRAEPLSFWERLFGGKSIRQENAVGDYRQKRFKKTKKRISKKRSRR